MIAGGFSRIDAESVVGELHQSGHVPGLAVDRLLEDAEAMPFGTQGRSYRNNPTDGRHRSGSGLTSGTLGTLKPGRSFSP